MIVSDGWCPGRPPAERIARWLLDQRHPELCYHLVGELEVRASLARVHAGHSLQDVIDFRARLLGEETEVVRAALAFVAEATGLALLALEAR